MMERLGQQDREGKEFLLSQLSVFWGNRHPVICWWWAVKVGRRVPGVQRGPRRNWSHADRRMMPGMEALQAQGRLTEGACGLL